MDQAVIGPARYRLDGIRRNLVPSIALLPAGRPDPEVAVFEAFLTSFPLDHIFSFQFFLRSIGRTRYLQPVLLKPGIGKSARIIHEILTVDVGTMLDILTVIYGMW